MHTQGKKKRKMNVSIVLQFCFICAGKQQRSYFRNEAIKQIQNEHNHPPTTTKQTSTWQCHLHAFE